MATAQTTIRDPAFSGLRRAAEEWDRRAGPERQVIDVVCLVPDVPTFFEAIAAWDERHYFPILIDDVEYSLKFLRAFRPAKVVRFPSRGASGTPEELWTRALVAAGRAWVPDGTPPREQPRGDVVPASLGPVPPGAVATHPGSPALAGAVALAAGRFQPLFRWEMEKRFNDVLSSEEAIKAALTLEAELAVRFGRHGELGDELDFLTLAGDYPYRFIDNGEMNAFDDMILRSYPSKERWGFAGRLMGDPVASVYRAMCSLFLPARSGLLLNAYSDPTAPWTEYDMKGATELLNRRLKVAHRSLEEARIRGWHQAFDPVNPYDLVMINSSGGEDNFGLFAGSKGHTPDVPASGPTAVLIIHSFSAARPDDPATIAGRWLANGAFVYYGSSNEPYLQAFRTPALVASCLDRNLPVVAAVRRLHFEIFGQPWRLAYFGDPLYRLRPVAPPSPRLADWAPLAGWTAYAEYRPPEPGATDAVRMNWALKTAIVRLTSTATASKAADLAGTLLGIDRGRLDPALLPIYDSLLVDTLLQANRGAELLDRLQRIAPEERSPDVRRHLETVQAAALGRAEATGDFRQGVALWTGLLRSEVPADTFLSYTRRVGDLATAPAQLADWRNRLRSGRQSSPADSPHVKVLDDEIKRIDGKIREAGGGR